MNWNSRRKKIKEKNNFIIKNDNKMIENKENHFYKDLNCSICFENMDIIGKINCCEHKFCYLCIIQWSEITNLCPLCKKEFKFIEEYQLINNSIKFISRYEVSAKRQRIDNDDFDENENLLQEDYDNDEFKNLDEYDLNDPFIDISEEFYYYFDEDEEENNKISNSKKCNKKIEIIELSSEDEKSLNKKEKSQNEICIISSPETTADKKSTNSPLFIPETPKKDWPKKPLPIPKPLSPLNRNLLKKKNRV